MFIVPNFPHLRGVEMDVQYKELLIPPAEAGTLPVSHWKSDPDVDPSYKFAPTSKVYLNGLLVRQCPIPTTRLLNVRPSGDDRVPRRGLVRVHPGEADYEEICRRQCLFHLLPTSSISPSSAKIAEAHRVQQNGFTPPASDASKSVNGGSPHLGYPELQIAQALANGINENGNVHPTSNSIS